MKQPKFWLRFRVWLDTSVVHPFGAWIYFERDWEWGGKLMMTGIHPNHKDLADAGLRDYCTLDVGEFSSSVCPWCHQEAFQERRMAILKRRGISEENVRRADELLATREEIYKRGKRMAFFNTWLGTVFLVGGVTFLIFHLWIAGVVWVLLGLWDLHQGRKGRAKNEAYYKEGERLEQLVRVELI